MGNFLAITAWAQVIATFLSFVGVLLLALQIRGTAKSADLEALFTFLERFRDAEARLIAANDDQSHQAAFNELLNLLEVSAAANRRRLFRRTTRQIVREKLIDVLAILRGTPEILPLIEDAVTSATTLVEIRRFMEKNREAIKSVSAARTASAAAGEKNRVPSPECP